MPAFVNPPELYSNDLANLVVPTIAEWLRPAALAPLADRFSGNAEEQDLYLGLPLCLTLVLFAAGRTPMRTRAALLATLLLLIVASLGPVLHVAGRRLPVPLPWATVAHLPLLRGALPCRIGVFADLAAASAAALCIAARGRATLAVAVVACLFLIPGSARSARTPVRHPCLFERARIATDIGPGRLLVLPYGSGDSMLWQALAGMSYAQAGGLLSFVPNSFSADPLTLPLLLGRGAPDFPASLLAFSRRFGVDDILIGPGTSDDLQRALLALPLARHAVCGVTILANPRGLLPAAPAPAHTPPDAAARSSPPPATPRP